MTMKGYSTFPIGPGLEPHYQTQFSVKAKTLVEWVEMQWAYSTALADWAKHYV